MPAVLHVLTGPTAVGKTEWALRWAEDNGAEIISGDSLLFYRGMDIGTAKPSPAELARVPHHLIDIRPPTQPMDVTEYVGQARAVVSDIVSRGRKVLVTGGSGFYLRTFFGPVADGVAVSPAIRACVAELSADNAVAELRRLNPLGLGTLDTANPRRVARALERCLASGRTLEELRRDFAAQRPPFAEYSVVLARLDRESSDLAGRIEQRVAAMLGAGLVDEVQRLRAAGLEQNRSAAKAIGYREVLAMLDGLLPEPQLAAAIARNTRALVKKQRTWFRTQLPPHQVVMAGAIQTTGELFAAQ